MKLVVDFNDKTRDRIDPATFHKRLPISNTAKMLTTTKTSATTSTTSALKTTHNAISTATGHEQTQTGQYCTVKNVLSGPHSGAFCKIMDITVSGFGKLDIESELLFVRLVIEEKVKN